MRMIMVIKSLLKKIRLKRSEFTGKITNNRDNLMSST